MHRGYTGIYKNSLVHIHSGDKKMLDILKL